MIKYEVTVDDNGNKFWRLNGELHRTDGPAVEYVNGTKLWYLNGKLHRDNGPAIECASGTKEWYLNGKLHRDNGPAIEYADGSKSWYLNDKVFTEAQWRKQVKPKTKKTKTKAPCEGRVVEVEGVRYRLVAE